MQARNGTILCIHEEPDVLRSLYWALHHEFTVMTAPDGATAVEMLRKHDFDVIVSDHDRHGTTGQELLRQARELAPRAMRILLTGYPACKDELSRMVREAAMRARARPAGLRWSPLAEQTHPDRLLVLDDDATIRVILEQVVGEGTRLHHAGSLAEADAVLERESIAVVVSEMHIGGAHTTPLLRRLKSTHPEIVCIVLSDTQEAQPVRTLITEEAIFRFVPKPVRPGSLKVLVASAIERHRELQRQAAGPLRRLLRVA